MPVQNITDLSDFLTDVLQPGNSIVDFSAGWCGPCKRIAPKFHELSEQWKNVRFYKVDIDEVPEAAEEYEVQAMPTFILFSNGSEVSRFAGANIQKLEEELQKYFG